MIVEKFKKLSKIDKELWVDGDAKIQIDFMIGNSNWMEKSFKLRRTVSIN